MVFYLYIIVLGIYGNSLENMFFQEKDYTSYVLNTTKQSASSSINSTNEMLRTPIFRKHT